MTAAKGDRVAVATHDGHTGAATGRHDFGTVLDITPLGVLEVIFDDGTHCRITQAEAITGPAFDVLRILRDAPAPPVQPMQLYADLGFRHLVVVSTLDTRQAIASFDILDLRAAEEEMERHGDTGKFTDRFGIALAIEMRK